LSAPPPRQLPALDPDTAFFWTAGADGRLEIARCTACARYIHPPLPHCPMCGAGRVVPAVVSGRGRVASFTVNHQPWLPGLAVPYVFAAIELAEQAHLYVFSNIVECPVEAVAIGMPVAVTFERHDDVHLPLFRPDDGATAHG
jgi:uncharacterized OB-fold protein